MKTLYTLDRKKTLKANTIIELFNSSQLNINDENMVNIIDDLFPNGISKHGITYLIDNNYKAHEKQYCGVKHCSMIEVVLEETRRNNFKHLPSRMQSIYAWDNLDDAIKFDCDGGNPIFKIKSKDFFVGDMSLLKAQHSVLGYFNMAKKYWAGEKSDSPLLEYLVTLPTAIGNFIPRN